MLNLNKFLGDGDNEGEIPFGVILSLVDGSRATAIIQGRSGRDFSQAYSPGALQISEMAGVIQVTLRIHNLGDVESSGAYVWLFVVRKDETIKVVRIRQSISVKVRSFNDLLYSSSLAEFGVNNFEEVINVYALVCDPLFDKFEPQVNDFIKYIKDGDFQKALDLNVCRSSRKMASLNLSETSLQVSGNSIHHNKGYADFIISSTDAGENANFGVVNADGSHKPIINDLLNQPQNVILQTLRLHEGDLVFYLDSPLGMKLSNNSGHCTVSSPGPDIIDLSWEDGGGEDFNDFQIRLIHR